MQQCERLLLLIIFVFNSRYFGVGVYIHDTDMTRNDWIWARDEKQKLRVDPIVVPEKQVCKNYKILLLSACCK